METNESPKHRPRLDMVGVKTSWASCEAFLLLRGGSTHFQGWQTCSSTVSVQTDSDGEQCAVYVQLVHAHRQLAAAGAAGPADSAAAAADCVDSVDCVRERIDLLLTVCFQSSNKTELLPPPAAAAPLLLVVVGPFDGWLPPSNPTE